MKYKLDIRHVVAFDKDELIEGTKTLLTKFDNIKQAPRTAIVYFTDKTMEMFKKYEHVIELVVYDIEYLYYIKPTSLPDHLIGEPYVSDDTYEYSLMCDDAKIFAELKMKL